MNKFIISILDANSINHLVVFLTGITSIPAGTACCIFFSLPNPSEPPSWYYLGYLTNEKPSAIYKLANLAQSNHRNLLTGELTQPVFNFDQAPVNLAQVGISIEPIDTVIHMVPAIQTAASNVTAFTLFINKTVNNIYNYCASFSRSKTEYLSDPMIPPTTQLVPLSVIQNWYETYSRRLSNDQDFWKSLN